MVTQPRKKPKRGNGRGSVRKLPSGNWQWRITLTLPDGTSHNFKGTTPTKSEAEDKIAEMRADATRNRLEIQRDITLAEYIDEWHERRKPQQAAKYTVARDVLIRRHIKPKLGHMQLSQITPRLLEQFYAGLTVQDERLEAQAGVKPLGDSMKRQIHNLLHQMFNDAIKHEVVTRNPTTVVKPQYTRKLEVQEEKVKAWTEEEARAFYQAARDDNRGIVFCFMLATGLRLGEALGLRWENVDLETGEVHIREALVSLSGHAHRTGPKTQRSRRTIRVSGDALAILREMPQRTALDRAALEAPLRKNPDEKRQVTYQGCDSVFPSSTGTPMLPDNARRLMQRICKQAQVPYKGTHVLRHSFISIQGARGTPVEVISAHVGHSRASFTQDMYRTVFKKEREVLTLDLSEQD